MRLEHEQKSGVISVYFILAEVLTSGYQPAALLIFPFQSR